MKPRNHEELEKFLSNDNTPSIIDHDRVREIRTQREMSMDDLARLMRMSTSNISRIETGTYPHTTTSTLSRMAQILEVHPSELIVKDPTQAIKPSQDPEVKLDLDTLKYLAKGKKPRLVIGNLQMSVPDRLLPELIVLINRGDEEESKG